MEITPGHVGPDAVWCFRLSPQTHRQRSGFQKM